MIIIGIDPGISGGIAVISNRKIFTLQKMPETPKEIFDFFKKFSKMDAICYLEKVNGQPGQGGVAMFTFGMNFGHIQMALIANQIRAITVSPQKWQKHYSIGTKSQCSSKSEWKNKLKAKAEQLYPTHKIFLWGADALLIAEYGRSIENK